MKIFVLACMLIATTTAVLLPYTKASALRQRRDVSELSQPAYDYLPPAVKFAIPAAVETTTALPLEVTEINTEVVAAPEETVVLGDNGYEYKTVRRLKYRYRTRRDVSHLAREYLPPNNDYLPPKNAEAETPIAEEEPQINDVAGPRIASEYLPPAGAEETPLDTDTVEVEVASAAPKVSNEYLPPNAEVDSEVEPALEDQKITEAPAVAETEAPIANVKSADEEEPEAAPEDSAILAEDGYHYKQPEEVPPQLKLTATEEYLPPVADESGVDGGDAIIVEGPEESAVLTKDGYHYRAVKRFRF